MLRKPGGNFPRRCVEIIDVVEGFKLATRQLVERALHRFDDFEKSDASLQKSMDRCLIRRIQHGRRRG